MINVFANALSNSGEDYWDCWDRTMNDGGSNWAPDPYFGYMQLPLMLRLEPYTEKAYKVYHKKDLLFYFPKSLVKEKKEKQMVHTDFFRKKLEGYRVERKGE
jgi:hypothetical protein